MSLLKNLEYDVVSQAIHQSEQTTDAELMVVLAKRADDYRYIPTLWAALLALLVPACVWALGFWLDVVDLFLIQLAVFVTVALVFRFPVILYRVVPKKVRHLRARSLARCQFLEQGLHHTQSSSGVLIFIAEAEHYVEILADSGISQFVNQQQWSAIVDALIVSIKQGKTQQGIVSAVETCGKLLSEFVPATSQKNELPNHLIVLD